MKSKPPLDFEHRSEPLVSERAFRHRLARGAFVGAGVIVVSLFAGMLGYHVLEGMAWIDAFVNAAMILSGMGPVTPLNTAAGKLFAGLYAIYSGLAIILVAGIMFAPVVHRFLHRFHLESEEKDKKDG